jgi:methionyl-tRNA formyltransferase
LPQYRGAAPINRAIINGEVETGITTFFLNEQIDAGKIIFREKLTIGPDETAGELHDRLMVTGSVLVIRTVESIVSGSVGEMVQDSLTDAETTLKQAPKIYKEDCRINWDQDLPTVYNFIRGLSPHPGAWSMLKMPDGTSQTLKIFKTLPEAGITGHIPGEILTDGKTYIKIGVQNGLINLVSLQLAGRKVMNNGDFLRGFGWIFAETHGI